jgi:hypothetical protein
MTAIFASTPPKLPVSQTVRASYAIVGGNLRQLVFICDGEIFREKGADEQGSTAQAEAGRA